MTAMSFELPGGLLGCWCPAPPSEWFCRVNAMSPDSDLATTVRNSRCRFTISLLLQNSRMADAAFRPIVAASLSEAELTAGLVSSSPLARLGALARLVWAGAYRDEFARHTAIALSPGLFLRYKRYSLNRRIR